VKCWHVLYTKPHKEHQVSGILESKGFELYLPTIQVRKNGRRKTEPFFSCYLFIRMDPAEDLPSVRWTPGLRRIVSFGDKLAIVPEGVISLIRRRLAQMRELNCSGCSFKSGERVLIKDGPLKDFEAVFDRALSSRDRAVVLVDLLGRWTRCEVDVGCLERVY